MTDGRERLPSPPLPASISRTGLVDWAELCVLGDRKSLSRPQMEQDLRRNGSRNVEIHTRDVWIELARRRQLMGARWPLQLDRSTGDLTRRPTASNQLFYYFLAALSLGVDVDNHGRKLFEYCVADVLPALTGSFALVLGDPRSGSASQGRGIPADMQDAVDLYTLLGKEKGAEKLETTDKDLGLDIVSWRRFYDDRGGYLHFVGQCATGKDWFAEGKASDLKLPRWEKYVHWDVTPVRFFAIPFVIGANPIQFRRASQDGGLVLDRPRLLELATKAPLKEQHAWRILQYCKELYGSRLRGLRYETFTEGSILERRGRARAAVA